MESSHQHGHHHDATQSQGHAHGHGHGHGHEQGQGHGHGDGHAPAAAGHAPAAEDWFDEDFVKAWLKEQEVQADARRRQFVALRAFIPKNPDQEFRYLNLGAGSGALDAILLEQFPGANAVVLDASLTMLSATRKTLARFGERVEYIQADLSSPEWLGAVEGPFDFIISTQTIHLLRHSRRIRELYREILKLTGHGGTFLNMDYVRPARAELAPLADWIARDAEAGFAPSDGSVGLPATMLEQLGWLSEAGFGCVEVYWKAMDLALFGAIRDHLHMPWGHGSAPASGHSHG
ncbi:MAG: class I SAM-dependent methyltransferase [Chloroflexi bacterium]|nr:class I SAM-dependent methyltransferase [Chloroflexota bacterium]